MKLIAAGGFKDITRISSSSPDIWQQICMTNKDNIITLLDHYITSLNEIRGVINDTKESEIHDFFESARDYRESFTIQVLSKRSSLSQLTSPTNPAPLPLLLQCWPLNPSASKTSVSTTTVNLQKVLFASNSAPNPRQMQRSRLCATTDM